MGKNGIPVNGADASYGNRLSETGRWIRHRLCRGLDFAMPINGLNMDEAMVQFGLFLDLGQDEMARNTPGLEKELMYMEKSCRIQYIRLNNGKVAEPSFPSADRVWEECCFRRNCMGEKAAGSGIMAAWLVLMGAQRLDDIGSGRALNAGILEKYLITSLISYEHVCFKSRGCSIWDDPLLYLMVLSRRLIVFLDENKSVNCFKSKGAGLYFSDRNCSDGMLMMKRLRKAFRDMHLYMHAFDDGIVRCTIPADVSAAV